MGRDEALAHKRQRRLQHQMAEPTDDMSIICDEGRKQRQDQARGSFPETACLNTKC